MEFRHFFDFVLKLYDELYCTWIVSQYIHKGFQGKLFWQETMREPIGAEIEKVLHFF